MAVSGTLSVALAFSETTTGDNTGGATNRINVGQSPIVINNGNTDFQFQKSYRKTLTLTASTPFDLDLTAAVDDLGTKNFATVKLIYVYNRGAANVLVGAAALNTWFAALNSAADKVVATPSSPVLTCNLLGAGWTVDATHKLLRFDPGASAGTVDVIIFGT